MPQQKIVRVGWREENRVGGRNKGNEPMQRINFTQLLVAAIALTVVFYLVINYQGGDLRGTNMTMTADLADDDLTLRQPLLPGREPPPREGQSEFSTDQNSARLPVRTPALQLPEVQIPSVGLNGEQGANRVQPQIVEPDFSRFKVEQSNESRLAPINSAAPITGESEQAPPSPWGKPIQPDNLQAYRPMLPPESAQGGNSWLTPEITQLNLRVRESQSEPPLGQIEQHQQQLRNLASLTSIAGSPSSGEPSRHHSFRVHVVRSGETLQGIAKRYYHREDPYLEIYVANQDVLSSPINLPVGTTIKIPDLEGSILANQ